MKLKVCDALSDERYEDVARVHYKHRLTPQGQTIESGKVFRVYCKETGEEAYLIARGLSSDEPRIRIDFQVRQKLRVQRDKIYDFQFSKADLCGEVWWALHATDTQYSFAAKISLLSLAISLVLGALGLLLGLLGLRPH